ncbi:MAG: hypothetical protein H0V70_12330 [Ktedonobacteraceae bacterium]|nr:hypothetical protein [Ktedonobacteraceae bacterium]
MGDTHDPYSSHPREQPSRDDPQAPKDPLWPYLGDWSSLQNGTTYRQLMQEFFERGIRPQISQELPLEDPLARYKNIPLHARFLYTSMDSLVEYCILKHYTTLKGLSRDRCDIYLSLEQFINPVETFDYLDHSPVLKQSGVYIGYNDLPGMFFWNRQWEGEYISFRPHMTEEGINMTLLCVFQEIREDATLNAVRRIKQNLEKD